MHTVLCCGVPEQKRAAVFACACTALVDVALLSALSVTMSMCRELDCKCLICFLSMHRSSWPAAYWDDWMRLSSVRKGRQCIRPEICRTYNFGEKGSSHGQYYDRYLKPIKLNDAWVNWGGQDLGYLDSEKYAEEMTATVALAEPVALHVDNLHSKQGVIKMMYSSRQEYEQLASVLGIIDDWKDGVPRASYKGIVKVRLNREAAAADEIRGECLLVPLPTNQTDAHRSPKAKLPVDILRTG